MKPTISILGLTKAFGKKLAVDNVNLEIPPGVVYGLLGPNGAGKTTLVRMLSTMIRPTSGTALVNGFDISGEAEKVRLSIGVLPEETVVVEDNGQSLLNHISFETQRI